MLLFRFKFSRTIAIVCIGIALQVPFTLALFLTQLFEVPATLLVTPRNLFLHRTVHYKFWHTCLGRATKRFLIIGSDILAIFVCIGFLLAIVVLIGYGFGDLFDTSKFQRYADSQRVKDVIAWLNAYGIQVTGPEIVKRIQQPLTEFVQGVGGFGKNERALRPSVSLSPREPRALMSPREPALLRLPAVDDRCPNPTVNCRKTKCWV